MSFIITVCLILFVGWLLFGDNESLENASNEDLEAELRSRYHSQP